MGLLDFLKSRAEGPAPLPSGSFTVDREGQILSTTVSSSFPKESLREIGGFVLRAFREAAPLELAFAEISFNFGAISIKARELRGGAIIFLSPRGSGRK
jgi:hypothetical protein